MGLSCGILLLKAFVAANTLLQNTQFDFLALDIHMELQLRLIQSRPVTLIRFACLFLFRV